MGKHEKHEKISEVSDKTEPEERLFLNKTLNAALDSFDNLFCRRCLVVSAPPLFCLFCTREAL